MINDSFDLWDQCRTTLEKYFVFDKIFDLYRYDSNFNSLKQELLAMKKEFFEPNYRFIFLHYDTDYYTYPNVPGMMLTNLQKMLVDLDIPNYFCLIITNHNNLKSELDYLNTTFTTDAYPISSIFCQLQKCHVADTLSQIDINPELLEYNYSCFNNTPRCHRRTLISLLAHDDLLEKGLVSYVK
jgi:hypothetical protein